MNASIQEQDRCFAEIALGERQLDADQLSICTREGVVALASRVAPDIQEKVRQEVHHAVAVELAHRKTVAPVLQQIAAAGIDMLVLKGSALAYSLYDQPWKRLRNDTDLLVRHADRQAVSDLLLGAGFELRLPTIGETAYAEEAYYFTDDAGLEHCIDLHWRLKNNWLLSRRVTFDDLWNDRVPLPDFAEGAHRCSNVWMLIVACLHRFSHIDYVAYQEAGFVRHESDFTLWMYDIHLLACSLDEGSWVRLIELSRQRGVAALMLDGLARASQLFRTPVPDRVMQLLSVSDGQLSLVQFGSREDWYNFLAVPSGLKPLYVWQRLFPARGHMDARYGTDSSLAARYVKRWLVGLH